MTDTMNQEAPIYIIVMGVSGSGKSTIGQALAESLDLAYVEADDLHPKANIDKMAAGIPLDDNDREPWLSHCADVWRTAGIGTKGAVLGCSALKLKYRKTLISGLPAPARIVYLDGTKELIAERMRSRSNHFMPTSLLESQFATLEIPTEDEGAIAVDLGLSVSEMVASAREKLSL